MSPTIESRDNIVSSTETLVLVLKPIARLSIRAERIRVTKRTLKAMMAIAETTFAVEAEAVVEAAEAVEVVAVQAARRPLVPM